MPETCGEAFPGDPNITCEKAMPCWLTHTSKTHRKSWKGRAVSTSKERKKEAAGIAQGIPPAKTTGPPQVQPKNGETRKREGIEQANVQVDGDWAENFDLVLRELAESGLPFTSQQITAKVGLPPGHPSAIGARINLAARQGLITDVGVTKSRRDNRHASRVTIWQGI